MVSGVLVEVVGVGCAVMHPPSMRAVSIEMSNDKVFLMFGTVPHHRESVKEKSFGVPLSEMLRRYRSCAIRE